MNCPICEQEMKLKGKDETAGREDKKYDRTIFSCEDCDTWISLEVPKNA